MGAGVMIAVATGLAGCSSEPEADVESPGVIVPGGPGERASVVDEGQASQHRRAPRVTGADVDYMRMMIPHHEQAVVMTELVPDRTDTERVRSLAERIDVTQAGEVEAMEAWLDRHADAVDGNDGHGGHGDEGGHELMPGMATPEQLDQLRSAQGDEFDRLFLELMITHHEGALTMAEDYLPQGVEPTALHMAQEVITTQTSEIEHMRNMLDG